MEELRQAVDQEPGFPECLDHPDEEESSALLPHTAVPVQHVPGQESCPADGAGLQGRAKVLNTPPPAHTFRTDVESMRGLAVAAVILYHFYPDGFTGGFVGVDVFFAISGFVISLMLSGWFAGNSYSLQKFYAFRSRRLLPASTAALVATLIASACVLDYLSFQDVLEDGWWAGTFRANYRFLLLNTDYGAQRGTVSPLLHFWSLAVEEQFYVVFPLLAWVLWRLPKSVRWVVVGATVVGSLVYSQHLLDQGDQMTAFYMLSSRWWEMAAGYLAFQVHEALDKPGSSAIRSTLSFAGAGMVAYSMFATQIARTFPGLSAAWSVVGTAALLSAGMQAPVNAALGSASWLRWLGKRSYSLYLWHWPVIVLGGFEGAGLGALARAMMAVLTLSIASERWIERPFRQVKHIWKGIGIGMSGLAAFAVTWAILGAVVRLPEFTAQAVTESLGNATSEAAFYSHLQVLNRSLNYDAFPANLYPPLDHLNLEYTYDTELKGCNSRVCSFPLPGANPDVTRPVMLLVGDSHGAHWFVQMRAVAYALGMDMKAAIRSSCVFTTPAVAETYTESNEVVRKSCFKFLQTAIEAATDADVVVISRLFGNSPAMSPDAQIELHNARQAARPGRSAVTWYMGDSPAGLWGSDLVKAGKPIVQEPKEAVVQGDQQMAVLSSTPGMWYTSSVPLFCVPRNGQMQCPTVVGSTAVYKDKHHLTGPMGHYLAPRMVGFLQALHPDLWAALCGMVHSEPDVCLHA